MFVVTFVCHVIVLLTFGSRHVLWHSTGSRINLSTGNRGQIDPRPYKLFNIEKMV